MFHLIALRICWMYNCLPLTSLTLPITIWACCRFLDPKSSTARSSRVYPLFKRDLYLFSSAFQAKTMFWPILIWSIRFCKSKSSSILLNYYAVKADDCCIWLFAIDSWSCDSISNLSYKTDSKFFWTIFTLSSTKSLKLAI